MTEAPRGIEIKPYFVPVFGIGKPLSQEQLSGLVHWFAEESFPNQIISPENDEIKIGFGVMAEPTGSTGVFRQTLRRAKLPQTAKLEVHFPLDPISNRQENTHAIEKLATFAVDALSWGDTVSISPATTGYGVIFERECNHTQICGLGNKPIFRRKSGKIFR